MSNLQKNILCSFFMYSIRIMCVYNFDYEQLQIHSDPSISQNFQRDPKLQMNQFSVSFCLFFSKLVKFRPLD